VGNLRGIANFSRPTSTRSFESAISELTDDDDEIVRGAVDWEDSDVNDGATIKRDKSSLGDDLTELLDDQLKQHTVSQAHTPGTSISGSSLDTGSSFFSVESSLPDQSGMVRPCDGVDPQTAAELAAIPDETPDDDAIEAALARLEGSYVKKSQISLPPDADSADKENVAPLSIDKNTVPFAEDSWQHEPAQTMLHEQSTDSVPLQAVSLHLSSTHNSGLFQAAFASKMSISALVASNGSDSGHNETSSLAAESEEYKLKAPPQPARSTFGRASLESRRPEDPLSVHMALPTGNHTPFILNYSSQELCHQLTLVERDALAEVDWKDLIELRWNQKLVPIQSWLGLLVERNVRGVEIVISRFNLMVNWVKSEVLLTRTLNERVQTICRFIHVAQRAREMQNFATMMQIVLALCSAVVSSLSTTWSRVPPEEMSIFREMEEIISPLRNFSRLRTELNAIDPMRGCIPFVGVYLTDLIFNSERPSFTDTPGSGPRLVNFEKMRTSASIVKSLIQCIQWSSNYKIEADRDLLAKCLYIQSLTTEEMEACKNFLSDEAHAA
jgi:GDP/GTP exchange factor required for growth at low temperature